MNHDFSKDLFDKYLEGKCTDEEKTIVEGWYLNALKNSDFVPDRENLTEVGEQIWSGIQPVRKTSSVVRYIGYAAAIIIAVLFIAKFRSPDVSAPAEKPVLTKKIDQPAPSDHIILASVTEKRMVKLPDSSVVILEKGSRLTILSAFNKKHNREVELEGKAYFDIAHNSAKPFIIYTGNVRTTVLGTAFDITAPKGLGSVKINVIRGMVEVKNMKAHWVTYLKKNMQVVSGDSLMISRTNVNAEKELSWNNKEGIKFDNISFKEAKKLLEDRFQIKINMDDPELQEEKFSTRLRENERLDHFLSIICSFNNSEYKFNADRTEVTIKPLNQN